VHATVISTVVCGAKGPHHMVCVSVALDSGVKTLSDFFSAEEEERRVSAARAAPLRNGRRDLVGCNLQGPGGAEGGGTALL